MEATPSPAEIAAQIAKERIGSSIGVLSFWGLLPVQPNDVQYELTACKADGDRLELTLVGYGDTTTLSIWQPTGFKAGKDSLTFKGAARVAWSWGSWDLHVEGKTLHIRGGASTDVEKRPVPAKDPAVSLKRA